MSQTLESLTLETETGKINHYDISYILGSNDSISLETAIEILARGNFEAKWVVSKVLVRYGEKVIPLLKEIILDESADVELRCSALRIVQQIKSPQVIFVISELFSLTQSEELMALAIETLASQGKECVDFLSNLLNQEEYRIFATKALAQIPHTSIIAPLLSVTKDENSEVRLYSITALKNFDRASILKVMIEALEDNSSSVRKEALIGIGLRLKKTQEIPLISIIAPLLNDLNLGVAQQAAITLSKCSHPLAVNFLEKSLISPYTPIPLKITIIKSLAWIETEKSIQSLGNYLILADHLLTLEIIKVLGRVTNSKITQDAIALRHLVIAILNNFYENIPSSKNTPEILQSLCYSWKQLKAKSALKYVQEITGNSKKYFNSLEAEKTLFHLKSLES
ncbi:HEAT repeat domain-containing protein [Cyanobacterium aponinum]|uniref:PBS lyase heat domain protein repeat-containing protein n=1 Tax=Cyanobacterium aponinum (strain PCC 10605) TaxID=755178 RepID=K9Z8V6_CYAAP|nr:HEAT repeat domain-containing protein [Cyanobacterium aponinum]AFZ55030.1 PBS lyase heat domain protein repeat-containing protein [Cyanobacterium aponinum PCC 10605]